MFRKVRDQAQFPERATVGSAGYDLFSIEEIYILPGEKKLINTGVCVILPEGTCGMIVGRSGMRVKSDIDVFNGIIDNDYRGEIHVYLKNEENSIYEIKCKDRIAQLLILKVELYENNDVCRVKRMKRDDRGFGSTGK